MNNFLKILIFDEVSAHVEEIKNQITKLDLGHLFITATDEATFTIKTKWLRPDLVVAGICLSILGNSRLLFTELTLSEVPVILIENDANADNDLFEQIFEKINRQFLVGTLADLPRLIQSVMLINCPNNSRHSHLFRIDNEESLLLQRLKERPSPTKNAAENANQAGF